MSSGIIIDNITRIEGHGAVEFILDGTRVVDVRLKLYESPRLFEALMVGRRFDEIADIACRICSICSTVHKVAALQAVEQAIGVSVSRQTALLRELAVQGGQIESHALHIYCLALPDYLGVNSFQDFAKYAPERLKVGLKIKKLGNMIQEVVGGRAIHPFNLIVGGVGRVPQQDQLNNISKQLAAIYTELLENIEYIISLNDILPQLASLPGCAISGGKSLFGNHLTTTNGNVVPLVKAAAWFAEKSYTYSHAKVSCFSDCACYFVGPLARMLQYMPSEYADHFMDTSIRSSLKARAIELKMAVEQVQVLIADLRDCGMKNESAAGVVIRSGIGTSLVEAPRGTLLHNYNLDNNGFCTATNIITPTAINQKAMARALNQLITFMDGADYDQIKSAAEILLRCYDPCISCAVH